MPGIKNKIYWEAFATKERNLAIDIVKSVISNNDGFIVNFNMFSDLALTMTIELPENRIPSLYQDLLSLTIISQQPPESINSGSNKDWWVLLNISFKQGEGNLRSDIPEVPG